MPAAYKKNQKELLAKVKEQYDGPPLEGPLRVEMDLYGEVSVAKFDGVDTAYGLKVGTKYKF